MNNIRVAATILYARVIASDAMENLKMFCVSEDAVRIVIHKRLHLSTEDVLVQIDVRIAFNGVVEVQASNLEFTSLTVEKIQHQTSHAIDDLVKQMKGNQNIMYHQVMYRDIL